jgi:hypothetical protein
MSKRIFFCAAAACLLTSVFAVSTTAKAQPVPLPLDARVKYLCAGMGLVPNYVDFAYCVVSLKETAALALATGAPIYRPRYRYHRIPRRGFVRHLPAASWPGGNDGFGAWSFSRSPAYEQHAREAGACAGLGLPAGSYIFAQCIADLDMTLFRVNLVGAD